jgi:hypothetical protein
MQACLAERWTRLFAWGSQDCALCACDVVQAVAGYDPALGLRGTYSDALGAARVIAAGGGLGAIATERLGPEISPALAQPADVGLVVNDGRECLATWSGSNWLAPGAEGIEALSPDAAVRAWRCVREVG